VNNFFYLVIQTIRMAEDKHRGQPGELQH